MTHRVLVVFPTGWDERQLAVLPPAVRARHEFVFDEPRDEDVGWDLDILGWIEERARRWRGRLDGVLSSSDYPGAAAAAALAAELGLPGAPPAAVLRAGHKLRARELQRAVVREVVPDFAALALDDPASWPSVFPRFVKPVRGSFSRFARLVRDRAALAALDTAAWADYSGHYPRLAEVLARRYAPELDSPRGLLAEEVLVGRQVTVEGCLRGREARLLGLVDTHVHADTQSFAAFHLPSDLPSAVQARLWDAALTVARALGLDHTLFNAEFLWDPESGRIGLVELNPRLCGQFADLYAKAGGPGGYELALALACGDPLPPPAFAPLLRRAASFPLRVFRSVRVVRAPGPLERRAAEATFEGTLVWSECSPGDELRVRAEAEDGVSVRYGIVNLAGADHAELRARLARIEATLDFEFAPL